MRAIAAVGGTGSRHSTNSCRSILKLSPAELRLAFKLRTLELNIAHAPAGDLRALNRAFNILAHPELRALL